MQLIEVSIAADYANAEQLTKFGVATTDLFAMQGVWHLSDDSQLAEEFEAWETASDEALIKLEADLE